MIETFLMLVAAVAFVIVVALLIAFLEVRSSRNNLRKLYRDTLNERDKLKEELEAERSKHRRTARALSVFTVDVGDLRAVRLRRRAEGLPDDAVFDEAAPCSLEIAGQ